MKLGVVEGFFGPAWPSGSREAYAQFLSENSGDFFIYAPKQDQHLRKAWREEWDKDFLNFLRDLSSKFCARGVSFGVGLSPFGLGESLKPEDEKLLLEKLRLLTQNGMKVLGIFFDDMPPSPNLARVQAQVTSVLKKEFPGEIVFCPSYYSFDPILEKVFGKMPDRYLEDIADLIPEDVSIAWTGPKVISPEIPVEHIREVGKLLRRKPYMWENLFANDGPRNCKFLKLVPFSGRESELAALTEAWGLNMMNQPYLSQITFLGAVNVLKRGMDAEEAFAQAIKAIVSPGFGAFLEMHRRDFREKGLEVITPEEKSVLLGNLSEFPDPAAREVEAWLRGEYVVGAECLTD